MIQIWIIIRSSGYKILLLRAQVTFVSAFPNPRKHANLTEFNSVPDTSRHMPNALKVGMSTFGHFNMMKNFSTNAPVWCFDALMNPEVQEIMKQDYDLAYVSLFFNFCFLPAIHDKKVFINWTRNEYSLYYYY